MPMINAYDEIKKYETTRGCRLVSVQYLAGKPNVMARMHKGPFGLWYSTQFNRDNMFKDNYQSIEGFMKRNKIFYKIT